MTRGSFPTASRFAAHPRAQAELPAQILARLPSRPQHEDEAHRRYDEWLSRLAGR